MLDLLVIAFINETEARATVSTGKKFYAFQQQPIYGKEKHKGFCITYMFPTDTGLKAIFPLAPI